MSPITDYVEWILLRNYPQARYCGVPLEWVWGYFSLYGARCEAMWQKMVLGHFRGLKGVLKTRNWTLLIRLFFKNQIKYCKNTQKENQTLIFKTDYRLMKVKSILGAFCNTFYHLSLRSFLSIFSGRFCCNWKLYTCSVRLYAHAYLHVRRYAPDPDLVLKTIGIKPSISSNLNCSCEFYKRTRLILNVHHLT